MSDELKIIQNKRKLINKYLVNILDKMNYHYGWNGDLKLTYNDYCCRESLINERNNLDKLGKLVVEKICDKNNNERKKKFLSDDFIVIGGV